MTAAPRLDLRGLTGAQGKTGRDRPIATGLATARPAANLITPDSFYYATDTGALSYSDGSAWTDVRVGPGDPVTSLPASPIDKQQALLTDSLTAPTYAWLLQYEAGITDANKWLFIGGSPAYMHIATYESIGTADATFRNLTTDGPSFTAPRAGDYVVRWGAAIAAAGSVENFMYMGVAVGNNTPAAPIGNHRINQSGYAPQANIGGEKLLAGVTASGVVKARYRVDTGGSTGSQFGERWIAVTPLRVA